MTCWFVSFLFFTYWGNRLWRPDWGLLWGFLDFWIRTISFLSEAKFDKKSWIKWGNTFKEELDAVAKDLVKKSGDEEGKSPAWKSDHFEYKNNIKSIYSKSLSEKLKKAWNLDVAYWSTIFSKRSKDHGLLPNRITSCLLYSRKSRGKWPIWSEIFTNLKNTQR